MPLVDIAVALRQRLGRTFRTAVDVEHYWGGVHAWAKAQRRSFGDVEKRGSRLHYLPRPVSDLEASSTQRIDKWLWFARVVKSRSLAAKLVEAGHVRINGVRSGNAAKALHPGDVLTIALERQVRVLRVLAEGDRRGPFKEASLLFEDLAVPCGDAASRAAG